MPKEVRKFGNETYTLHPKVALNTKAYVSSYAEAYRKSGNKARIIKQKSGYSLYVRRK